MEKFKIVEFAIIGFFIGVIVSAYILFVTSTGKALGALLSTVSLNPLLNLSPQEYKDSIVINFLFFIVVYTLYTIILGLIMRKGTKTKILISLLLILLATGIFFEQKNMQATSPNIAEYTFENEVSQGYLSLSKKEQYFGNEARGDLNTDTKEDIAFIIKRNAGDTAGDRYYLTVSLQSDKGYVGTNLIFVGEKIEIKNIAIESGLIKISYLNSSEDNEATEDQPEKTFYAQIVDSILEETDAPEEIATSTPVQE